MTGAVVVLVMIAAFFALVWAGQRRMMYFPFGTPPPPAEAGLPGAQEVTFDTSDGLTLRGWLVSSREQSALTVIVFNGNAGNRAFRAPLAAALGRRKISVLLFDYRGFGGNPGAPTQDGLAKDARAARGFLVRRGVDQSQIVYFGESLGTAVAAELAVEHAPAALVLRSPFMSMADVGQHHYPFMPVRLMLRDRYATGDLIRKVRCPLLVVAGDRDAIVPPEHSRALYDAANDPKRLAIIRGADHNDEALLSGREMIDAITSFLAAVSTRGSR